MSDELIVVKQLPIIEERLRSMSKDIDIAVTEALSLVCTEDTVKSVKAIRADLTKQFGALEEQRKAVKKAVLAPYEAFEAVYKECVSDKFKAADADLKSKIDDVENGLKAEKEKQLKEYYDELCVAYGIDFVPYEKLKINITKSTSLKAFKEYVEKALSAIMDDIAIISKQQYKDEIFAEYKQSLSLKQAVTHVEEIHAAIEAERAKREANAEADARAEEAVEKVKALSAPEQISPPAQDDDPVLTVAFRVTAKRSKLKELKQFIIDGGYDYE